MTWSLLLDALKLSWGPISGIATFVIAKHFWPVYKKWVNLKSDISTAYTQYANYCPKFHFVETTDVYNGSTDAFGQAIAGPPRFEPVIDNQQEVDSVIQSLRKLAGRTRAIKDSTAGYNLLAYLKILPNVDKLNLVSKNLIFWSNRIVDMPAVDAVRDIDNSRQSIKEILALMGD